MIGYFGYTHFKKTSILLNVIHKDADSVIKIGVHDITKTLVLDALSSPSYYWENTQSFKKKKKKDSIKREDIGVDLRPYSMVFYTIKNIENTLFTTIQIDDLEALERYITKYSKKKSGTIITNAKGYKHVILEKSKLVLAWDAEKLAVALTTGTPIEKLKTVFEDVLLNDMLIADKNHDIIKKLSKTSDHITFLTKEGTIALNFIDGKAMINGTYHTQDSDTYKTKTTYNSLSEASLQFYFDANFINKKNRIVFAERLKNVSFLTKSNINAQELANKTNGFLGLTIKGTTMQSDTIVSYEYNDNFEKVEVKTLQEKEAPKMSLSLGNSDNESLKSYLESVGAVRNDILTSIPYYTFYVKEKRSETFFDTVKEKIEVNEKQSSSFFKLSVNFNRLQQDVSIPSASEVFKLLEGLKIEANQIEGTNEIKIKGNISAKKEDINTISQMFFELQKKKVNVNLDQ